MSQSSGLATFGLFEVDQANSRGDLQNHSPSPSPSRTCRPFKGSVKKTLGRRNTFRETFHTDQNVHDGRVAIVGMAVKMPGAESPDDLWRLLNSGTSTSTTVPLSRFDVHAYADGGRHGAALKANTGHFINGLDEFDNEFFTVSPREAKMMDPQQRLLLHVAQEALDDAGFVPRSSYSSDPDHVGVFIGAATNDYVHNVRDNIDIHYVSGTLPAFLSGRISYALSLGGPSTVYDTACSSSATALHAAVRALRNGDCRMALAGGVNAVISPNLFIGLDVAAFLSRTGQSKPFDAEADGYSRGEGCGLFVLKRMSDALLDHDRILGVIRDIEANQSYASSSITRTHSPSQAALLCRLLEKSRLQPGDIDVVEAHAAGTKQGDTSELLAVRDVFLQQQVVRQAPLYMSSIKATIGHLEAASGAASLAKVLLMMQHQTIPRQVGIRKLNSVMDAIPSRQITTPFQTTPWPERVDGNPRRAIINNYGAAGSNVSVLVEEYVEGPQTVGSDKNDSTLVLGLSAKSERALLEMKKRYIACLGDLPNEAALPDFCYTSTARRQLYDYRLSIASPNDKCELLGRLEEASVVQVQLGTVDVVFVYPGHGSQGPGMGHILYESCPAFRQCIDECNTVVVDNGLPTFLPYLLGGDGQVVEEPGVVEQMALVSFEVALSKVWTTWGVAPTAVIGHSLGEYTALVVSGILSLREALLLVGRRAQLIEKCCVPNHSGMMSVPLPSDLLQDIFQANPNCMNLVVACRNSQNRQTVAGPLSELEALRAKLQADYGIHSKFLPGRFAYHSPAMLAIIEELAAAVKSVEFKPPTIPCASTVTGSLLGTDQVLATTHLLQHCLDPVEFSGAVSSLSSTLDNADNTVCWIEVSPQRTLLPLVLTIVPNPNATHIFVESPLPGTDPWVALAEGLSRIYRTSLPVQWKQVFSCLGRPRCIPLPPYPFRCRSFYVPYRDPSSPSQPARTTASSSDASPSPYFDFSSLAFLQRPSRKNGQEAILLLSNNHVSTYSDAHRVASIPMCPASLYLETVLDGVAMTHEHIYGRTPKRFSISHLEFLKPFTPGDHPPTDMVLAVRWTTENEYDFSFSSNAFGGEHGDDFLAKETSHARGSCRSQQDVESRGSLDLNLDLSHTLQRLQALDPAIREDVEVFSTKSVYDVIFPRVVEYAPPFRSLRRVVVTEDRSEGYGIMEVVTGQGFGPAYMDPMVHLPGFVVNLHAGHDELFLCAGIGSVDLTTTAFCEQAYQVYTTISPLTKGAWLADTVVLTSESPRIVARLKNIQFKRVSRHALTAQLRPPRGLSVLGPAPANEPLSPISLPSRSLTRPPSTSPALPFKAILSTSLHIPEHGIKDGSTLESLGLDSLTSIEVLHTLRTQYGPTLSSDFLREHATVGEVEVALQTNLLPSPRSSRATMGTYDCLEHIQEGLESAFVPICFIHDGAGSVSPYRKLATLGREVWAIKAPSAEACGWEATEEMAASYASVIAKAIPGGSILSGWSFGGVVAFEVARQLLTAGYRVQGLVLLDAPPPTGGVTLSDDLIASILSRGKARPTTASVHQQLERHVQMMSRYQATKLNPPTPLPCVYLRCDEGYQAPADVEVHEWFTARENHNATVAEWTALLGGGLHVLDVPGHHFEMFRASRIDSTSQAVLKACNLVEEQLEHTP